MKDGARQRRFRARVVIAQHRLLHYRQAFFERLRARCDEHDIELRLVHGQPSPQEATKSDVGTLLWADAVSNRFWHVRGKDLLWQPFPDQLRDADMVVLMQENRILSNYRWLLRLGVPSRQRIAYWGHGRNLQSRAPHGLRERWKRWFVNRVDWWFAYTELTRSILHQDCYPDARITVLDNAIDNEQFAANLAGVTPALLDECRKRIGAEPGDPIGLYCGSLYEDKRLDLLLDSADIVRARQSRFHLVVVGDGPSRSLVTAAAADRPWLHWVGVQRGTEKAAWFRLANAYLSPGAVGLHVLDAFQAGIPMITTDTALHGPEIAYLRSGHNGFIVSAKAKTFADSYLALLLDPMCLDRIRDAATQDARRYTLDNMVQRFLSGIEGCLAAPKAS